MGVLFKKNSDLDTAVSSSSDDSISLYKPISEFAWKDANKRQRKELAILAYKSESY